ncbi:MAG: hypothetical protein AAGC77_05650 [Pseudomonadota bacterium]
MSAKDMIRNIAVVSTFLFTVACAVNEDTAVSQGEGTMALQQYGVTEFEASGSREAHSVFLVGLLQLHNFEFEDARASFQRTLEIDPDFTMAVWGEALTHWQPLWPTSNIDAARAVFEKLGDTPEERTSKGRTERERDYLQTLELLLAEGDRLERRIAYSDALFALQEKYPDDLDAAAFYALSILARSNGRKPYYYMRAGAVTEEILDKNPLHPGALHYNIHSYDDPIHAPLGLRAARDYIKVAPSAVHALHMGAHIFYPLAMWEEGVERNKLSYHEAVSRQANPDDRHHGETFHSLSWLPYGLQQMGDYDGALGYIAKIARQAELYPDFRMARMHYIETRASYLIDTQDWDHPLADIEIDHAGLSPYAVVTDLYLQGIRALERDAIAMAEDALANMGDPKVPASGFRPHVTPALLHMALEAQIADRKGDTPKAEALLKRAADIETGWPLDVGPPQPVQPMAELLADFYREQGETEKARSYYQLSLRTAPGRVRTLDGLNALPSTTP